MILKECERLARPGARPKNAVVGLKTGSSGDARRPQVKSTGGGQSPPVVVFQQTTKSNKQTNNSVKATGGGQCPVHWAKPLSRTVVFQKKKHMCQQQLSSKAVFFVVTQMSLSVYSRKFLVSLFSSQISPVSNSGCLTRLGCEQS